MPDLGDIYNSNWISIGAVEMENWQCQHISQQLKDINVLFHSKTVNWDENVDFMKICIHLDQVRRELDKEQAAAKHNETKAQA